MKTITIILFFISYAAIAPYDFEPSEAFPFGKINPDAPQQIKDFELMIGECNCKSSTRKKDGTWTDGIDMLWRFKYIMNGMAIQDETLKSDGAHSGSIRQFNADSSKWYVHYYSSKGIPKTLPAWEGKKVDGKIVLYREQKAPNGMDGYFRLTFYDITKTGYKWIGEWVDKSKSVVFPTWKITCLKK